MDIVQKGGCVLPLITRGVYCDSGEKAYERESHYYIDFQISSALISINSILNGFPDNVLFKNKYQYYHYFCDHLLYSIGQISNRFIITKNDRGVILERKKMNLKNFNFSSDAFPILSDKRARNVIEHIDEYNQKIINRQRGVGGFNLIDESTQEELINILKTTKSIHPYTLNLINKELYIRYKDNDIIISIDNLKCELNQLQLNVNELLAVIEC